MSVIYKITVLLKYKKVMYRLFTNRNYIQKLSSLVANVRQIVTIMRGYLALTGNIDDVVTRVHSRDGHVVTRVHSRGERCDGHVVTRVHSRGERGRIVRVFRAVYVFPYGRPLFLPLLPVI